MVSTMRSCTGAVTVLHMRVPLNHAGSCRQDPLYNEHKVPEKTQKEASDTVHKIALATAEKTGKYGDENFQEYKQSVIAAAVEAASPKVAEIKHKANVKAMKELRDVKARARATVEVSKKQEEKQEAVSA